MHDIGTAGQNARTSRSLVLYQIPLHRNRLYLPLVKKAFRQTGFSCCRPTDLYFHASMIDNDRIKA